jgi:hypothetical protein
MAIIHVIMALKDESARIEDISNEENNPLFSMSP